MRTSNLFFLLLMPTIVMIVGCSNNKEKNDVILKADSSISTAMADNALDGATVLAFGPENVLFVGDSKSGMVHAIPTAGETVSDAIPYNLKGIDDLIAKALEIESADLVVNDMKIHPTTQEAYIAVKKGHNPGAKSYVMTVNPMTSAIGMLDVSNKRSVQIKNPVNPDFNFWRDIPASTLNITDIDYYDGSIYVAGITNGEFASTLRKIAYPFSDAQDQVKSIEMYHAVHTQMETRAPIRTMAISELNGEPTLIASYTCTPLVTMPLSEITDGAMVKGKTVAELGYGNAPIDMMVYTAQEMDGSYDDKLLITHKQRSGSLISLKDVAKAAKEGEGMVGITAQEATGTAGMKITASPTSAILHIDNQNPQFVAALKRDIETGSLDLISEIKGAFLRLSEFISEYDFPDYEYPEAQAMTKQFHDMAKPMEGYPELVSEKE